MSLDTRHDTGCPCHCSIIQTAAWLTLDTVSASQSYSPAAAQDGDLAAELDLRGVVLLPPQHFDRHRLHPAQDRLVHLHAEKAWACWDCQLSRPADCPGGVLKFLFLPTVLFLMSQVRDVLTDVMTAKHRSRVGHLTRPVLWSVQADWLLGLAKYCSLNPDLYLAEGAGADLPLPPVRPPADLNVLGPQLPVAEGDPRQVQRPVWRRPLAPRIAVGARAAGVAELTSGPLLGKVGRKLLNEQAPAERSAVTPGLCCNIRTGRTPRGSEPAFAQRNCYSWASRNTIVRKLQHITSSRGAQKPGCHIASIRSSIAASTALISSLWW